MTTLRQIEANRRNAKLSTGPKTEQGRDAARRNAFQHGLTGEGVVNTAEEQALIEAKLKEWTDFYRPSDPDAEWAVEEAARMSVRIRRCWTHDWTLRMLALERAESSWDDDRRLAAEELGAKLARNPTLIGRRLRRTRQGCEWLLVRWEGLAAILREDRDWSETQRALALDLLGTPVELRDGPGRIDPPRVEGDDLRAARLAVAGEEIAALERLRDETLVGLEEHEQLAAMMGYAPDLDRSIQLLMRYEAASSRRMIRAIEVLTRKQRHESNDEPTPRPIPIPTPTARPSFSNARPASVPEPTPGARAGSPPPAWTPPVIPIPTRPTPMPAPVPTPTTAHSNGLAESTFGVALGASAGNRRERRARKSLRRRGSGK